MERLYFGTLLLDAIKAEQNATHASEDDVVVLLLANSWSGYSEPSQARDLERMGAKLLKIPARTTDKLQPLDVNFNRQYKIFYDRVMEEASYSDILQNVTSRKGILNLHSLVIDQFTSARYRALILFPGVLRTIL